MSDAFVSGLLLGASLIIAIGAQNAFVLRQGLLRQHRLPVALFCALSDALLIIAGVAGLGSLIGNHRGLMLAIGIAGALVLVWYGIKAARRAFHPDTIHMDESAPPARLLPVLATCAAFTWGNPHVYLDTVVLIGSLSTAWTPGAARAWFATGAATASFVWFFGLAYGSRVLVPLFRKPMAWRVLDGLIALVMWAIALRLLLSL
ncbi:L-lysine exporter family protein LysE/ArgO [Luteibacter rhizovicinus]|uniref:L-lysine exporter family protein LysE/ArgO n=1 Tax=Luteibacter rhizovicinus TaxID=242606 RepID=A0A4R3YUL7_9GAMM|nr:LysE/ArgO family amino acid transporter [Luteibacter rhizovicinus]TCV96096.1 L-lysine exporter family protein LysE/ArgO [Luteibacter rhizovicinus]